MANQMKQLLASQDLSGAFGEVFYMVDDNYRTGAQGWFRPDGTGPLNLFNARNPGQVFSTADFTTDAVTLQTANDALVDFRGDVLYFTPGNYSIGAVITVDVPYARWMGAEYKSPRYGAPKPVRNTTLTSTIANFLTVGAVDGMELAFLRFVPLTAANNVLFSTAAVGTYWHDFLCDYRGVATSAATAFSSTTSVNVDCHFDQFTWLTDAPQGPMFDMSGACLHMLYSNFYHSHGETGGTYVTSLIDINVDNVDGIVVSGGRGNISTVGATVVTQLALMSDQTANTQHITVEDFYGSVGYATATTLVNNAGADAETELCRNFLRTVAGGTGETLYTS